MRRFFPAASPSCFLSSLLLAGLCSGAALADERLDGLKQTDTNICMRGGNTAPGAPKNLKLVRGYCTCVVDTYWAQVSKAEVEQLMSSGYAPAIDRRKDERMATASAACRR